MSGPGKLVLQTNSDSGPRAALAELVQAWARDVATGVPIHILELGPERRGAKSGCECPSCSLPLTAVNAAKTEFVKRPHFRHPEGAARDECLVLAARAAVMRQFQDEGWLDLPRRQMSGSVTGLSGDIHKVWIERRPERVRIAQVNFHDRTVAVLTLDDGRQLRVLLTGTLEGELVLDANGHPVPTIFLDVNDPSLAGMEPDELRRRLRLLPSAVCSWRTHWDDEELAELAAAAARERALFHFDEVPDGLDLPADMDPALRRQTVLHHEVMKLLAQSQRLHVPGWVAEAEATWPDGHVRRRQASSEPVVLSLDLVSLEQRFGHIVPDVTCKASPSDGGPQLYPFFIEVTVTNSVTAERLERIREAGQATLEIDLSLAGGRVDREGLRHLVVEELAIKRWLHHPEQARRAVALSSELAKEDALARAAGDRRAALRVTPVADLAHQYLDAALQLADAEAAKYLDGKQPIKAAEDAKSARAALAEVVEALEAHGYPEAADANLFGMHGMLARLLSIQLGRPVGYRVDNVASVLDDIEQSLQGVRLSDTSIYLIAVRTYRPPLTDSQQLRFEAWAGKVRSSVQAGEAMYSRDPTYDRFLSILFPAMAAALDKPGGKRRLDAAPAYGEWQAAKQAGVPTRLHAPFLENSPGLGGVEQHYPDPRPGDMWLRGSALDAWKKGNPEWAKEWFANNAKAGKSDT